MYSLLIFFCRPNPTTHLNFTRIPAHQPHNSAEDGEDESPRQKKNPNQEATMNHQATEKLRVQQQKNINQMKSIS
jgi:hypothetical protein